MSLGEQAALKSETVGLNSLQENFVPFFSGGPATPFPGTVQNENMWPLAQKLLTISRWQIVKPSAERL